jgi:type II secretory pathway component PulJ
MTPADTTVKHCRRYTLLELIAALAIFVMAAAAVTTTAAGALRIYRRSQAISTTENDLLLATARIERDLRNTFPFTGIGFEGTSDQVSFAGIVRGEGAGGDVLAQPGRIAYARDSSGNLVSERSPYAKATASRQTTPQTTVQLATNIAELNFRYLAFDTQAKLYGWQDSWLPQSGIPVAVEIRIIPSRPASRIRFERSVFIPMTNALQN